MTASRHGNKQICSISRASFLSESPTPNGLPKHLTTSYFPEVSVQNHVWTNFPRIYTNLQSKVWLQFCFQVRRPVISTIVNQFISFYEKSLPTYLIHENSKCQNGQIFQLFTLYSKDYHFSITKLVSIILFSVLYYILK